MQSDENNFIFGRKKEYQQAVSTDDVICHLNDETVMMYNFFPLLCVMFKENNMDNADFFQNPIQFIEHEVGNFRTVMNGHHDITDLLLNHGSEIEQTDSDGYTLDFKVVFTDIRKPLKFVKTTCKSCNGMHNEVALVLLENGADVNEDNEEGQTSLYSAAKMEIKI
ncbi:unnamed protein product [Mytilus edulis]|uniref:Uncharacterized protein n=1 Tax=Mytilus edulis TaxID=6550 RepID=A0A8S3RNC0_MYTED|nr:unnamed protein product [Mytilus edulis]